MKNFKNLDPSEYLRILWRRRWYALSGFVLVAIGVGIYSWRTPNVYRSESTIVVELAAIPQDYVRSSDRSTPAQQITGIRQLAQSRSFMERLIQEFQLFGYGAGNTFSMDEAINALSKSIQIGNPSPNTFRISFAATDAGLAQTINRRVVETLIQSSNSSRKSKAVEADQFLDEQLRQTQQELVATEEKIRQFKTEHLGELPDQGNANLSALNTLNAQLAAVENALQRSRDQHKRLEFRAQEQKRLRALTQNIPVPPIKSPEPVAIPKNNPAIDRLAAKQAELAALTTRYTSGHPDVVRLAREVEELKKQIDASMSENATPTPMLPDEIKTDNAISAPPSETDPMLEIEAAEVRIEAESIKAEIANREKERNAILDQIRAYQAKLKLAPSLELELTSLSRENEVLRQQYSSLQGKKFQAQMTASLETNKNSDTYRVMDEANLPEKPIFPDRGQILMIGLGAGFLVGIGAAFGREFLDSTLSSEDEVAAALKLPVLVTISEIPGKQPKKLIRSLGLRKSA
jgi:succinoglycan biosynthesis transport protein ExoP